MSCNKYNAGLLRTTVAFKRKSKVSDGKGGFATSWSTVFGSPSLAYVKSVSGAERYASNRVEAGVRLRVVVRYFDGLLESDAVDISGKRHNIRFVNNLEMRNRWLEIDVDGGAAA